MILRGEAPRRVIGEIAHRFSVSKHQASRLVMTESAAFSAAAFEDCCRELEVERYKIIAALDELTCPVCGVLDGQVHDLGDYAVGVTAPPFHPNCRCCTAPYFADMEGIGERAARDAETGRHIDLPANTTYAAWKEKVLDKSRKDAIMKAGGISGGLNRFSPAAEEHAARYYEAVRRTKADVKAIAKNTKYTEEEIRAVKEFVFLEKHDLGSGSAQRFAPSYEMAQSWQRLREGKNIQKHDLTLIAHELLERELMRQGYSQADAHLQASRKYNYGKEAEEYYDKIGKHTKKR